MELSMTPLARKLLIKPKQRVRLVNAPSGYASSLEPLPEEVSIGTSKQGSDVVQLFAKDQADLRKHLATALAALKEGGTFWICFPKGSSKMQTDLTRDIGWGAVTAAGFAGVSLVSIDDTWSAMRFR
jgi:hypothetical protein